MKFILVLIFFLNVFLLSQPSFLGSGTIDDPYQIWTKEHLLELSDSVNSNNIYLIYPPGGYGRWCTNKHFCLMQDIDTVTQSIGWRYFYGHFHSGSNTITVAIDYDYYSNPNTSSALFASLGMNSSIDSLTIEGYFINGGGIVNSNGGTIFHCINNANVQSYGIAHYNYNSGTISHCLNNGIVSGVDYIGGIAAVNVGTISNCINTGKITGTEFTAGGYNGVGGIVAASGNTISNCINLGDITGINYISGIAGSVLGGFYSLSSITNCFNSGYIKGNKYIGGIVGFINDYGNITNCINTGVVEGEEDVGSIVGKE